MENLKKINIEDYEKVLKESSYKYTIQRKQILSVLVDENNKHLSTEEIYDRIRETYPNIGLATVYRTMQIFEKLGIAVKLYLDDSIVRYELTALNGTHNYHHMICKKCKEVFEIEEDLLKDLEDRIYKERSFKVLNHNLNFIGLCKDCKIKKDNEF